MKIYPGKLITIKLLESMGACWRQRELFSKVFPEGVRLSKKALYEAWDEGLDVSWFVEKILTPEADHTHDLVIGGVWRAYMNSGEHGETEANALFMEYMKAFIDVFMDLVKDPNNRHDWFKGSDDYYLAPF